MLIFMRTTLNLNDAIATKTKHLAMERSTTLTALVEEALLDWLARAEGADESFDLPSTGGSLPPGFPVHGSEGKMIAFLESFHDPV